MNPTRWKPALRIAATADAVAVLVAPTTHFVELGWAILYRGAGPSIVWKPFLALLAIGSTLFSFP